MKEHHKQMIIIGALVIVVGAGLWWGVANNWGQPSAATPATPAKTT